MSTAEQFRDQWQDLYKKVNEYGPERPVRERLKKFFRELSESASRVHYGYGTRGNALYLFEDGSCLSTTGAESTKDWPWGCPSVVDVSEQVTEPVQVYSTVYGLHAVRIRS